MFLGLKKKLNIDSQSLLKEITLLILVALTITVIWFRQGVLYGGGESGLPFSDLNLTLKQTLSVWLNSYLGVPSIHQVNNLPFYFFANFLFNFGISGWLVQAFIHFILISVGMLSMYVLIKVTIGKEFNFKYLAFFAGLFYLLNPYSMSQVWSRGLYMQFIPFASFPLMLLLIILALEKSKLVFILLLLIVSFIFSAGFTPPYVLTFWIMMTVVFGYYFLICRKNFRKLLKLGSFFIVLLVGWSLIHSWWLVHYVLLGNSLYLANQSVTNEGLGTLMAVSKYSPFLSVIRLMQDGLFDSPWLFGDFYQTIFFRLLSWIVPALAILSRSGIKRSKFLKFFAGMFLFSLFICLGAGLPLGFLFVLLFNHFPILQLFRNPYEKFGIILLISYTPFVALGFFRFSEIISKFHQKLGRFLAGFVIIILFLILVWPMWTGLVITTKDNVNFVNIPYYYQDFKDWLKQNNKEDNRIFMLPFMPGPGVTLRWEGRTYSGIDPSINFLDYSIISWVQDFPYTRPLLNEVYKDISKYPVSSMLGLLRAKYLVIRDDVSQVDERDLKQEENLLHIIRSPSDINDKLPTICKNQFSVVQSIDHVLFACQIPSDLANWNKYRYLHLRLKTDKPATLDIALRDQNQHRPRWVYTSNSTYYQTSSSNWTELMLDLNLPVYGDKDFNPSQVFVLEILVYPNPSAKESLINRIDLKAAFLDEGQETKVDNYQFINQFGKLRLYQLKKYQDFPDISILSGIKIVDQLTDMFKDAENLSSINGQIGYIVKSQNESFTFLEPTIIQRLALKKISEYQYLTSIEGQNVKYLVLHKTFNRWWKVIPNVSEDDLKDNIFAEIALLKKQTLDENNHLIVNGYANLWKIEDGDKKYAIIFLPQIISNILLRISLALTASISLFLIVYWCKTKFSKI